MDICHICSNYDGFFTNLMEEQISIGIKPRVFYFRAKERGMPDVNSSYVDIRLNYSNWYRPFFYLKENFIIRDFFSLYKKGMFELNHAHTLFSDGYIALKAKKRWDIPYIVAVRDVDLNVFMKYRVNLRGIGIEILKEAEKIIFLSPTYRDLTLSKYVPKRLKEDFQKKSIIIPNGIDPYYLEKKPLSSSKLDKKNLHIISVGYISKRKNQLAVCKAVEILNKIGIKADYTIIGKSLDDKILEKVKSYSFVKHIPFLPKDKLIDEYRKANIFVMPSLTETFGLVYAEAMSQGLPVIYTKEQGFDRQFNEGDVGYHVDCLNAEEIAHRIQDVVNNYSIISSRCIELSNKFNWVKITELYLKLYGEIISEK